MQALKKTTFVGIFGTMAYKCLVLYDLNNERNVALNARKFVNCELEGKEEEEVVTDIKITSRHSP
jgi:hypothetical protein